MPPQLGMFGQSYRRRRMAAQQSDVIPEDVQSTLNAPTDPQAYAPPRGLFGSSAPKRPSTWDSIKSHPLAFLLGGTERLDKIDAQDRMDQMLDSLPIDQGERVRAEMDPEGYFRSLNQAAM